MSDLVILVGGRGKRLGNLTNYTPKPLIRINKKTFLDNLLSKFLKYNYEKIYLLCSYKSRKFFKLYHKKKIHNSLIYCINEGQSKDTGGALYKLRNRIKKNFFLINGDSYFDINMNNLKNISLDKTIGSVALTNNNDYKNNNKMNNLKINEKKLIQFSDSKTNLMNGGVYFFKKKIFNHIPNKKISLENEILKKLINKKKIKGFFSKSKFIDIGSIEKLKMIKKDPKLLQEKAFFLDRDGVINKLNNDGYIKTFKEFIFLPGVADGIKYLNENNFRVIIITNQACVGKSIISEKQLKNIHLNMRDCLKNKNNSYIDDIYYSPYFKFSKKKKYRKQKFDRKPNPGMVLKAISKWNINTNKSIFIGDQMTDFETAKKSGIKFYFKKKMSLKQQILNICKKKK